MLSIYQAFDRAVILQKRQLKRLKKHKWRVITGPHAGHLLWILNIAGLSETQQEYICRHHPDRIREIQNLHPRLKAKYRHELELSGLDV